jgi:alkyl hydroperoxide reductase subunit D
VAPAGGVSEDQVHDAVRIAATIQAAAVSLEMNGLGAIISYVAA